jgi:hypothetical protein
MKKLILISLLALFSQSVFSQIPNYVPSNGLVGWWPFNGNANDESGNGNNGTVNGATLTNDRFGNQNSAYSFEGSSNISLNNVSLSNVTKYSYTGWFKKASTTINQGANLISMSNPCNGPGGLRVGIGGNNQFCFGAEFQSCSSVWKYSQNQNYSDNTWHFFAAVYDGNIGQIQSSELILYIDGVLIPQIPFTQGNTGNVIAPINNLGVTALIGGFDASTSIRDIDDIGIWNRVLTDCEIQNLYTSTSPINTTTVSVCDSYTWNGATYNASGVYSGTTANCVTESLDLTITPSSTNTTTVSACDSYTWNGQLYSQSGVYSGPTINCVSESLNLTVNSSTSSSQAATALDSYNWSLNNQTYIQSGTYTATIPNAAGCDSVVTLNLTLNFTGITENLEAQISISPNPASDYVSLKVSESLLGKNYFIYDNSGRKIMEGIISQKEMVIKIGAFDDGIYLIKVNNEIQNTFRIIKQ